APVMDRVVDAAQGGMPVLGICNGFQVLCETHLLPGAMIKNAHRSFICRDQPLRVENVRTAWTTDYQQDQVIRVPLKNQDGQYVADERTLAELEAEGRVVFRYTAGATHGPAGFESNPNGSRNDIAGITNPTANVVARRPDPGPAVGTGFAPAQPGKGTRTGTAALAMFTSVLRSRVG